MSIYSSKTLGQRLEYKPGMRAHVTNPPRGYFDMLKTGDAVTFRNTLEGDFDMMHCFAVDKQLLGAVLPVLKGHLKKDGALWISWPKMKSSLDTNLDGNLVREAGTAAGLVDVKVAAVDDDWSALKFVYRSADRGE